MDEGWPKKINVAFTGLPAAFHSNIDAAFSREDGDFFLFKGAQYIRMSIASGMHNGYPRTIADGFPGLPEKFHSNLTAAISFPGVVNFYKKNAIVIYDYLRNELIKGPLLSGANGRVKFLDRIDAVVHDWEFGIKIYRNGKVIVGTAGEAYSAPRDVPVLGVITDGSGPPPGVVCPGNCNRCSDPSTCTECAHDFKLFASRPGQCVPELYAVDIPFNSFEQSTKNMLDHNLNEASFAGVQGNKGGAANFTKATFAELRPTTDRFPQFETHGWVKLTETLVTEGTLMKIDFDNGFTGHWKVIDRIGSAVVRFSLGDTENGIFQVTGTQPLQVGQWAHIHADYWDTQIRVSVDSQENRLALPSVLTEVLQKKGFFKIAKWRLGWQDNSTLGLDTLLDGFHIDYRACKGPCLGPTGTDGEMMDDSNPCQYCNGCWVNKECKRISTGASKNNCDNNTGTWCGGETTGTTEIKASSANPSKPHMLSSFWMLAYFAFVALLPVGRMGGACSSHGGAVGLFTLITVVALFVEPASAHNWMNLKSRHGDGRAFNFLVCKEEHFDVARDLDLAEICEEYLDDAPAYKAYF